MLPLHLDQISHADLHAFLGIRESKRLEYKRELSHDNKSTLLKAVTAFANTAGGDLVIGVEEADSIATAIDGFAPTKGVDDYKLWLKNVLRDLIEPALQGIDIQEVACPNERWVFIVRVPRSWIGPHRSLLDGHFYIRTSSSNERLDVPELRRAFGALDQDMTRIESFRRERLQKILAGDTPAPLADGPCVVLHLVPLPSFSTRDRIDIVNLVARGHHMPQPFGSGGSRSTVNLNGICNIAVSGTPFANGYGQLFRSGAYEGVSSANERDGARYWPGPALAKELVSTLQTAVVLQAAYDIAFPSFAMLSFVQADQLGLRVANNIGGYVDLKSGRDPIIAFPEILIEQATSDITTLVKPLLDMVWNAYGELSCPYHDRPG